MITVNQAQFNKDADRIAKTIERTSRILKKDAGDLIKQTALFAIRSAIIATPPGTGSKISTLKQKYRFRPLVKIPDTEGFWYITENGKLFKTNTQLSRGSVRKKSVKRVPKGIKKWDRKRKTWSYIPWPSGKRDLSDPLFKITFAGAGKVGWIAAYRQLGGPKPTDIGDNSKSAKPYSRVILTRDMISIANVVAYVAKIAPQSAAIGLNKAASIMEHTWIPKIERRLERDWNRNATSFVKGLGTLV